MKPIRKYSDDKLVAACRNNNRQAQRQLYELYSQPMFNVCYRILNQQEAAEDALQEAFVKMFGQLHSFREESTFGAWFKRIVVNHALNHLNKEKRKVENLEHLKYEKAHSDIEEEDDSNLPNYTVSQIQNAMEHLPEGYRIVFSLYLFEEYSHRDIAQELSITESTSKSQLNRAKRKIRQILSEKVN